MSDYFDRLLARHTPVAPGAGAVPQPGAGDGAGGTNAQGGAADAVPRVRVRPRLPGPFERVEALRDRTDAEDGLSPSDPRTAVPRPSQADERSGPRGLREIHTERHTVVRERPSATGPEEPQQAQPRPQSVPLRPAPTSRPLRPVANVPEQRAPRGAGPGDSGPDGTRAPEAGPAPALVVRSGEVVSRTAARPGSGDLTAERSARQQAAAARRGGARSGERVVHVRIGRLEVSAAAPPGAGRGGAGEPGRQPAGRTAPTVSLETYLARGRNGERSN